MENIEISHQFPTTSLPVLSPTAAHIACLAGARLQIRCLLSLEIIRNILLPQSFDVRNARLAWSPPAIPFNNANSTPPRKAPVARSNRVLIADDDNTRVYDLRDIKWNAVISNGSGGMGKNVHVEFGRTEDEVVIFTEYASKVTIWCLKTGRTVEIRDPKFSGKDGKGWGYRPSQQGKATGGGGVLALLCRSAGQDLLMLLAPRSYEVIKRVELPTVDAAGLKWSKDGRWIAVWDAPSTGYNMHILSADGHVYRTIRREPSEDADKWGIEGLGIKSVEWVPGSEWLAVGGWDRRVRILSTRTFSPVVFLDHTAQIIIPNLPVYTELVNSKGFRTYSETPQPATPPKATNEKGDTTIKQGISILAFNLDGTLCATRDDSTPTTVWIWDLRSLRPKTILIQYAPVKSLLWHPTSPSLLLIQSTHDSPTVYLYTVPSLSESSNSFTPAPPGIITLSTSITKPSGTAPARWDGKWLITPEDKNPALVFGHQQGYALVWPSGKDQILRFENDDDEQSDDSLFDILTGRTPIPKLRHLDVDDSFQGVDVDDTHAESFQDSTASFEDTFREKRRETMTRDESMYDESGLDEMF